VKKVWLNLNLVKIEKKYEDLNKNIEEFKATDLEAEKLQVIRAKIFVKRMMNHVKEVKNQAQKFNIYGCASVGECYPLEKALELAYLIQCGIQNKLKPIVLSDFKEELRKRLDPVNPVLVQTVSLSSSALSIGEKPAASQSKALGASARQS